MASHRLINDLVTNRQHREEIQAELTRLDQERADLVARAKLAGIPLSEIEWGAGLRLG